MNRQWTRTLAASLGLMCWLLAATSAGAQAQGGVIAFFDDCDNRPYLMRGDGTGRVRLADAYGSADDVSRGGWPITVLMNDWNSTLYAVEVTDVAGQMEVGPLVSLHSLGENLWFQGSVISLVTNRLAYVTPGPDPYGYPTSFWVANLVRDTAGKIIGTTNHRLLARSDAIGSPSDLPEGTPIYDGPNRGIAFSSDGGSLLVAVYGDLWRLYLGANGELLSKERLTQTRERVEWGPDFSPDGRKIAFMVYDLKFNTKGPNRGRYTYGAENIIYTLDLVPSATPVPVLTRDNLGEASGSIGPLRGTTWSPDGAYLAFNARSTKTRRTAPCGGGNTEIFIIRSDGSGQAIALTKTATTSMEWIPRWGWQ